MKVNKKRTLGILLAFMLAMLQVSCRSDQLSEAELKTDEVIVLESEVTPISVSPAGAEAGAENASGAGDSGGQAASGKQDASDEAGNEAGQDTGERLVELPQPGNSYYDLENVVLYLYLYEELPSNYITKAEARELGWEGGSVEKYKEGAAIGGDRFGNREELLPVEDGRTYTECDINTLGNDSRGAKRLVFSNDGLYFYTEDHYESFEEVIVTEGYEVIW